MKVVVGSSIGGFYPSIDLMKRLIALDSSCLIKQDVKPDNDADWGDEPLVYCGDGFFISDWPNSLTDMKTIFSFAWGDEARTNPELIKLVEELGINAAHLGYEISIAQVPDEVKWEIVSNEMGVEFVSERHRVWFGNSIK